MRNRDCNQESCKVTASFCFFVCITEGGSIHKEYGAQLQDAHKEPKNKCKEE